MPRLRNTSTGVVVSTSVEVAAKLGAEWAPVEVEKPVKRASKGRTKP